MGLLNKVLDGVLKEVTGKETLRLSVDDLIEIVDKEFILGSDDEYLKQLSKTAKGGIAGKKIDSKDKRYVLEIGALQRGMLITGRRKTVWVFDNETNKYYQLDKDRHWKKFYKAVLSSVNSEKIRRNR